MCHQGLSILTEECRWGRVSYRLSGLLPDFVRTLACLVDVPLPSLCDARVSRSLLAGGVFSSQLGSFALSLIICIGLLSCIVMTHPIGGDCVIASASIDRRLAHSANFERNTGGVPRNPSLRGERVVGTPSVSSSELNAGEVSVRACVCVCFQIKLAFY